MITVRKHPDNDYEWMLTWEPESPDERRWHVAYDARYVTRAKAEASLRSRVEAARQEDLRQQAEGGDRSYYLMVRAAIDAYLARFKR